jgi:prolyl-tRNA synthetase
MIVTADGQPVAALVRGDHELSLTKLKKALGAEVVELATAATIEEVTGGKTGFSGPVGLSIRTIADRSVVGMGSSVTGANKEDYHHQRTSGREFQIKESGDIGSRQTATSAPSARQARSRRRGVSR